LRPLLQGNVVRRTLVAGNWKMFGTRQLVRDVIGELRAMAHGATEVVICPPYPYLGPAADMVAGSALCLGGQDLHVAVEGAFTGAVSGAMLRDMGCAYVIVGHSERRQYFAESDELVATKAEAAIREGLRPIVCVGENEAEREAGRQFVVVERQLAAVTARLGASAMTQTVVAYEPVWAIGTGRTATPGQAQEIHAFLRGQLRRLDANVAESVRVLYGGSVKASNARELFAQQDIDGGLVGGASLGAVEFAAICMAAQGM
jgi:triosephosphate isomerase